MAEPVLDTLKHVVRSPQFNQAAPEQRLAFMRGYFEGHHPDPEVRKQFTQFTPEQQNQLAAEAMRQASIETTGETFQRSAEVALPTAGSFAGGYIGAPGGPLGVATGMGVGTGLGQLAAETLKPLTTGEAPDFSAFGEAAKQGALAFGLGGISEKAAKLAGPVAGALRKRFKGIPDDADVTAARTVLEPRGGGLTVGQQRSTGRAFIENILRNAFTSEGTFAKLDQANLEAIGHFAQDIAKRVSNSMPAQQLGKFVYENVIQANKAARVYGGQLFQTLRAKAGGQIPSQQQDALQFLNETQHLPGMQMVLSAFNGAKKGMEGGTSLERLRVLLGAKDAPKPPTRISPRPAKTNAPFKDPKAAEKAAIEADAQNKAAIQKYQQDLALHKKTWGVADYEDAMQAANELAGISYQLKRSLEPGAKGAAKLADTLYAKIVSQADDALSKLAPHLVKEAKAAKQFWSENVVGRFENELISEFIKKMDKTPGELPAFILSHGVDMLDAVKKATMSGTRAIRNSRGKVIEHTLPTWPQIQESVAGALIAQSVNPSKGIFSGIRHLKGDDLLARFHQLDIGNTQFTKKLLEGSNVNLKDIKRLAAAIDVASRHIAGSGGVFVRMKQAGALGGLAGAGAFGAHEAGADMPVTVATGVGIVVAPWVLARALTNRQYLKNVAEGLVGGPKSVFFRRLIVSSMGASESNRQFLEQKFDQAVQEGLPSVTQSLRPLGASISEPPQSR